MKFSQLDVNNDKHTNAITACLYLRRGWSVFPMKPKSKQPAVKWEPYQHERMSEADAIAHWTEHPTHGIGIVTGAISDLVIVDVDPRNGGDVDAVLAKGCKTKCVVQTGSDGRHFYFKHPGGVVRGKYKGLPGVDRQGDGRYVVAPPSIHPNGNPYRMLQGGEPGAPPKWLSEDHKADEKSRADEGDEASEPWVADTLANPEACEAGSQEATLSKLAWWAAKHLPEDVALAVLCRWTSGLTIFRKHEPWTVEHVAEKLTRAYEKRALEPGAAGPIQDDSEPSEAEVDQRATLRAAIQTSSRYCEGVSEKDDWIVKDFVAPGCYTEVIGVMKEGKSTLVCGLLRSLLLGDTFLGRECKQSRVLLLSEQVGLSLKATLTRGKIEASDDLLTLTIASTFGIDWDVVADEAINIAESEGCAVIVVDTLGRLASMSEEDEAKSIAVLNPFLKARSLGIAVVFVRHGRKAGGAVNVAARGSGAITGEMDVCLQITATRGLTSHYRHLEIVSRFTDAGDAHLEYTDGTYKLGEDPKAKKEREKRTPLSNILTSEPIKGLTLTEISDKLGDQGPDTKSGLSKQLATMVKEGIAERLGKGEKVRWRLVPKPAAGKVTE
jgi:hypothetical protein